MNNETEQNVKESSAFSYEIGIGTEIDLTKNIFLDCNIKYFNCGTHKLDKDLSKNLVGYKYSTGLIFKF